MSDFHDEDLSELERRMRAKLFDGRSGQVSHSTLSEEEQRIAAKLMGLDNAKRIANARDGRRVRLAPVVTTIAYWWLPSRDQRSDSWHIEVITNNRKAECLTGTDAEDLETRLAAYRRQNIVTRHVDPYATSSVRRSQS